MNGGNNSKDIILPGGAVFAGNAENVRREDWVAGARLIFSGKWLMGGGQYTTYYLSGSAHQAIQEKDEEGGYVTTALLGHGCYVKHIERWWYWDWCATRSTQSPAPGEIGLHKLHAYTLEGVRRTLAHAYARRRRLHAHQDKLASPGPVQGKS